MISIDALLVRRDFTLDIAFASDARVTALFGRSGSGKSTTIAVIAGLLRPERGRIEIDGEVLFDSARGIYTPKHRRRIGLVFQDAQLFPHMTVRQNLEYGRWFAADRRSLGSIDRVVATLGIGELLDRAPARLSGGEKQRVAIGRALLAEPRLLLLDEPLASLDRERKLEILPLIEALAHEHEVQVIYVSHAVEEVARLAGAVVVLDRGKVVAHGAPDDVLSTSATGATDRFAMLSVLSGQLADYDAEFALTPLLHPAGRIFVPGRIGAAGAFVRVVIRANDVAVATQRPRSLSIRNVLQGTVTAVSAGDGPVAVVEIALTGGARLLATVTRLAVHDLGLGEGDDVYALIKSVALDERPVGG